MTSTRRLGRLGARAAIITLVVAAAAGPAAASSSTVPEGPIQLGAIYSMSGAFAAFGPAQQNAAEAAVAQINADGGIAGRQIELIIRDDKSTPEGAVAAAQELVDLGVTAMQYIGTSPQTLQAAPVFNEAEIPVVTLLTDETFEDGTQWPYIFNNYSDAKQGVVPYGPFLNNLGVTEVVMINDTTPASTAFAGHLHDNLAEHDIEVLAEASFDPTAVDLTTEIQQLKEAGTDTLVAANIIGFGPLYNALRAVDWHPTIVETTAAFYDNSGELGEFAETTFATCNVGLQEGVEIPQKITDQLAVVTEKGGVQPDVIVSVLSAYDSLLQLKYAIETSGSLDGPAIAEAMETIDNMGFSNPEWTYTFTDEQHQGWPGENNHICTVSPLDEYGTPTVAEQSP